MEIRKTTGERSKKKTDHPKTTLVQTLKSNIAVAAADLNESIPAQTTSLIKCTQASKGR